MSASRFRRRLFRQLLDSIGRLLKSWWQVDRIRISPREGLLLRLRPGSLISVDGQPVEIVNRTVRQLADGPLVVYGCRSPDGPGQLCVSPGESRLASHIRWTVHGRDRALSELDVIVYRGISASM